MDDELDEEDLQQIAPIWPGPTKTKGHRTPTRPRGKDVLLLAAAPPS